MGLGPAGGVGKFLQDEVPNLYHPTMARSIALVPLLCAIALHAQTFVNPFNGNRNEFKQQDIVVLFNEAGGDSVQQQLFSFDWIGQLQGTPDPLGSSTPIGTLAGTALGSNGQYLNATAGRFNDDDRDDLLYLVETSTGWACGIGGLASEFLDVDSSITYDMVNPASFLTIAAAANNGPARIAVGDLDGDGADEAAIAWWEPAGDLVHIQILDTDGSLAPQARASLSDQLSLRVNNQYHAYDLACGDLNGDGAEELVLIGLEASGSGNANYQVFVQVYEVNSAGSNTITPQAHLVLDDAHVADDDLNGYLLGYAQTATTTLLTHADTLPGTSRDVLASFAFVYYGDPGFSYDNTFQYLLRTDAGLNNLTILDTLWDHWSTGSFDIDYPLEAGTGDINGDFTDDAVLLSATVNMFTVQNDTLLSKGSFGSVLLDENNNGTQESVDRMELGDVDQDGREEVIAFSKSFDGFDQHTFAVAVMGVDEDFSADPGGSHTFTDTEGSAMRSYAVAVGNLDGHDVYFGEPTITQCEYVQPVFIIGAVPSHFDVLDSVEYDVCDCYPVQDCDLSVTIKQTGTTSTEAEVEITSDWSVAYSGQAGGEVYGVELGLSLEHKYGEKFSEVNTQTNSQTITVAINAAADDMIEYTKIPITLYEYPVMNGVGDTVTWVLAGFPADNLSPQTIVANGKSVFNYTPDHEVGNLLSYPPISPTYDDVPGLPDAPGNWIILNESDVPNYTMSPTGGITYTLTSTSGLDWSIANTSYSSTTAEVSAEGFGAGAKVKGQYDASEMNMFKHSMNTSTEFEIEPVNIIGSPNEFNYVISPKIFWNTDGSGVVHFDLDMDSNVGSGSFWSLAYTVEPDPALNMPFRYDQVINPGLSNTVNLDRTKSMRFSVNKPAPGDSVSVYLRVFNYSFVATPGPVTFSLYHEDPDLGGTPITDVDGNTTFQTTGALGERGREEVEVRFIMTTAMFLDDFVKVYAILDPAGAMTEIHEGNNKGWAQLGYECNEPGAPVGVPQAGRGIDEVVALRLHPVPASDQVVIEHDLRGTGAAKGYVVISNAVGGTVERFNVPAPYTGRIFWNTRVLDAGLYLVSLYDDRGLVDAARAVIAH